MSTRQNAEIIVIGGGVVGAAILWALSHHHGSSALLIEQNTPASGATGSSSAILRVHYTNRWESSLALRSLDIFRNWKDLVGGACGYTPTGFLRIVGPHDADRLTKNVAVLTSLGAEVREVNLSDLHELEPELSLNGIGAAAYEPHGGYADPNETTMSLLSSAAQNGARISRGQRVTKIRVAHDHVEGVETTRGTLASEMVILATGAWTSALLSASNMHVALRPRLIRAGFVRRSEGHRHMTIMDDSIGTYVKPEGQTGTEFGLHYQWDVDPDRFSASVSLPAIVDGVAHLVARFPEMASAGIVRGWGAVDSFSPDGAPVIGRIADVQGLVVASGFSGAGFKIAPAVGLAIAELVEGRNPSVDISAFAAERLSTGKHMTSDLDYRRPQWRQELPGPQA